MAAPTVIKWVSTTFEGGVCQPEPDGQAWQPEAIFYATAFEALNKHQIFGSTHLDQPTRGAIVMDAKTSR